MGEIAGGFIISPPLADTELEQKILGWRAGGKEHVTVTMMDSPQPPLDGADLQRLDLLKIDIPGREIEALNGSKETILRCRPYVMIRSSATADLRHTLGALGYTFGLSENCLVAIPVDDPARSKLKLL